MQVALKQPLSNVQLELLKMFSHQLSDTDLVALRTTLAQFFAQRLIAQADAVWEENQWTDAEVDALLETKMRKKQ
jgi:hypothetical protein